MTRTLLLSGCFLLAACRLMAQGADVAIPSTRPSDAVVPVTLGQSVVALTGPWKFHVGDNPQWADAGFNDNSWPVAQLSAWPKPAFYSDGFVWVRFRVPVRTDAAEPLAVHTSAMAGDLVAYEIFVNGARVGSFGSFPPKARMESLPRGMTFDLPHGLCRPGETAQIALRIWYAPAARRSGGTDSVTVTFDQSRTLHAEDEVVRERALLREVPLMLVNVLVLLLGCAVLWSGWSSRSRDVVLCGAMMGSLPLLPLFLQFSEARLIDLSATSYFPLQVIAQLPSMFVSVVFIWGINGFRDRFFRRMMLGAMVIFNLASLVVFLPSRPSPLLTVAWFALPIGLRTFDILNVGANLWAAIKVPRNRVIAVTMMLVPGASLVHGLRTLFEAQGTNYFDLTFTLFGICLAAVLAQRAWAEWRTRDALQAEFEAAHELQQRLVPPALNLPGFHAASAYLPARQVGGDFFYLRSEDDGGVLVVLGDVSGKGLPAAMTVHAVMGALRTMPALPPVRILESLNRGLVGQLQGGFVTCCVARIGRDGAATLASAAHLPPYLDGREVEVEYGLPLGLTLDTEYLETQLSLAPGMQLTLVTDGVVEAQNQQGELFGFERTAAIANQPAAQIAQAARAFGQEDDITVLTVARMAPAIV
ncbi:MAG: PP2C family protein-serine/threonine phosphatase [Terracidiphilus sp.]